MAEPLPAIAIRAEGPGDEAAVFALNDFAFDGPEESRIIAGLRDAKLIALSLVAEEKGQILGHILFSWLPVTVDDRDVTAVALAPMAVHPHRQGQGIGSRLVREGLARLAGNGATAVIVVGHPGFYPRFGFSAEKARKLEAPFSGAAFMALELEPGALDGESGKVAYPAAFGLENDA
jgi:putative acetyltransferase